MKKLFAVLAFMCAVLTMNAQVVFTKFKLAKDSPFGAFPGRKMLDTKFKVTSDKALKYVFVDWYMVNGVGDVISGETGGIYNPNTEEFVKPKSIQCTGPFESGKSYGRYVSAVGTTTAKGAFAFPTVLKIMYMGTNNWIEIPITKDNITTFFPKIKWTEINRYNKAL